MHSTYKVRSTPLVSSNSTPLVSGMKGLPGVTRTGQHLSSHPSAPGGRVGGVLGGIKQEQGTENMERSPTEQWIDSTTTCRPLNFPAQPDYQLPNPVGESYLHVYFVKSPSLNSISKSHKFGILAFLLNTPYSPIPSQHQ